MSKLPLQSISCKDFCIPSLRQVYVLQTLVGKKRTLRYATPQEQHFFLQIVLHGMGYTMSLLQHIQIVQHKWSGQCIKRLCDLRSAGSLWN